MMKYPYYIITDATSDFPEQYFGGGVFCYTYDLLHRR